MIGFAQLNFFKEYADTVYQKTYHYFTENTPQYVSMINKHLLTFARTYINAVLRALTLGFGAAELVEDLDKKQAMDLARRIQTDLEKDVRHHIGIFVSLYEKKRSIF